MMTRKTRTITIRNTFHNTQVRIRIPEDAELANWQTEISDATRRRVWRTLCPWSDCECSGMVEVSEA